MDPSRFRRIGPVCEDFEAAWREGRRPLVELYLDRVPDCDRAELLVELRRLESQHLDASVETVALLGAASAENPVQASADDYAAKADGLATLGGYEILGKIGRGGMGIVYKARDRGRDELVALKTIQNMDPEGLYRFKQEFRALSGVSHPNLVPLYDLTSDGNDWFFTMKLVDGVPFDAWVRGRPDEAIEARRLRLRDGLRQLAEGIAALHAVGKLHRDVKPSNVLVTREGHVYLLDFGLVAELDQGGSHESTEQAVRGTVAYMAPEQAAAAPVTPACDWYAVGVMLYQALTHQLPFRGPALQILLDKQRLEPPPPCELSPDIPADSNDLCVQLLRTDPRVRPGGLEILRRLGSEPPSTPVAASLETILFGRSAHLRHLEEGYATVRQGRAVMAIVRGPSGMGKSSLVEHFLAQLRRRGAVVLAGRCHERESVPYKALDSLVDDLARYLRGLTPAEVEVRLPRDVGPLTRVFPVLGRVVTVAETASRSPLLGDDQDVRRRAFVGLRELLARMSDRAPLALHIDDLQWGDVDSALLLTDLLQPPDPPALLLLASHRSEDGNSPCLLALPQSQTGKSGIDRRDLEIGPLTESDTRELVLSHLGADGERVAAAIAAETRGNPIFIHELLREFQAREGRLPAGKLTVEGLIRARVNRLPEKGRRLLEVVAVSGRPVGEAEACAAANVSDERRHLVALLHTTRLVRCTGTRDGELETYHDRVRETIIDGLTPETHLGCHRTLAQALEESGRADPEHLATHLSAAGERARAGPHFARAADRASEALAFDRAAELYRLALDAGPLEVHDERRLRESLGDALANAGNGADAGQAYLAAAQGVVGAKELDLRRRAAEQLLKCGCSREGLDVLRAVLAGVGLRLVEKPWSLLVLVAEGLRLRLRGLASRECSADQIPPEELLRIDACYTASSGLALMDVTQCITFQIRHLRLALRAGEPFRVALALAMAAGHSGLAGGAGRRRAESVLERARALAVRLDQPLLHMMVALMGGIAAWGPGRWREGLRLTDRAEAIAEVSRLFLAGDRTKIRHFALDCLVMLGEWREAAERLPRFVKDARRRGDRFSTSVMLAHSYVPCLADDRPQDAEDVLRQALEEWPQEGFFVVSFWALYGRTEAVLYRGDGPAAWELVSRSWSALMRSTFVKHVQFLYILLLHLRARCALAAARLTPARGWLLGKRNRLLRAALRDARVIDRMRMPWAAPLVALLRAGVAALRGQRDECFAHLEIAESGFAAAEMNLYASATRRRAGQLIGGERGLPLVTSADSWMTGQDIRNPARLAAMLAPGFSEGDDPSTGG